MHCLFVPSSVYRSTDIQVTYISQNGSFTNSGVWRVTSEPEAPGVWRKIGPRAARPWRWTHDIARYAIWRSTSICGHRVKERISWPSNCIAVITTVPFVNSNQTEYRIWKTDGGKCIFYCDFDTRVFLTLTETAVHIWMSNWATLKINVEESLGSVQRPCNFEAICWNSSEQPKKVL
jgi:hypothetical protein